MVQEAGLTGQYIVWDMAKADIVRVTFYDNVSLKAAVKVGYGYTLW